METNNPNVDYYFTVQGYSSIEEWAKFHYMSLDEALDEGVIADDESDDLFVPQELFRRLLVRLGDAA